MLNRNSRNFMSLSLHDEKPLMSLELDQWMDFFIFFFRNLILPAEIYILLVIFPSFSTDQSELSVCAPGSDWFGEAEITLTSGLEVAFRTGFMFGLVLECSVNEKETEHFLQLSFISYDFAPLSASLLSDWNEVHRMTPADLESLQQELQLGSPMILSDTIPSDAWLIPLLFWGFFFVCF